MLSHAGGLADLIFGNIYLSAGKKEKEKIISSNLLGNDVWRFQAFDCFWKMKIIHAKISLNLESSQMNVKEQITPKMQKS